MKNEDGISLLFYLQKIFPGLYLLGRNLALLAPSTFREIYVIISFFIIHDDWLLICLSSFFNFVLIIGYLNLWLDEWKNFLYRIGRDENSEDSELFNSPNDILELRFWASYRGQTLARTGKFILPFLYLYSY